MSDLRSELETIEGVLDTEVDLKDGRSPGVRIHIAQGTDRRLVATKVQAVLAANGLRSKVAPPRSESDAAVAMPGVAPPRGSTYADPSRPLDPTGRRLVSVSISHDGDVVGIHVRASDGRSATERCVRGRSTIRDALLRAVNRLADPGGPHSVLRGIRVGEIEGAKFLLVLLTTAGGDRIGSALVDTTWEIAFARAVWAALVA